MPPLPMLLLSTTPIRPIKLKAFIVFCQYLSNYLLNIIIFKQCPFCLIKNLQTDIAITKTFVDMVYTVDMVYSVDIVYTVDMVYTVDNVDTVYTI